MSISFPHTVVHSLDAWSNYTGTLSRLAVPTCCTPGAAPGPDLEARLRQHGEALDAIVRHCFEQPTPARLRVVGAGWSLSNIVRPHEVLVDSAHMNGIVKVDARWTTPAYAWAAGARGGVPVLVECGAHLSAINRRLAEIGLAPRTSGAADGQRIAGAIATGTHGAAIKVGAVHDTVLAVHLLVGPGKALLLQPSKPFFTPDLAAWLTATTGVPTADTPDDELFHAAQVSLGSLGVVMSVVLDAVPLYGLRRRILQRRADDADVLATLSDLKTSRLFPHETREPYHFQVIFHPYPASDQSGAYVLAMWAEEAPPAHPQGAPVKAPSSDILAVVAALAGAIDHPVTVATARHLIHKFIHRIYEPGDHPAARPGEVFGPSALPPVSGTSVEVVVNQEDLARALPVVLGAIGKAAREGYPLLGSIGVRLVPRTDALLGMNIHPMNAFIEIPSLRNDDAAEVQRRVWGALDVAGVRYTCHWGQVHNLDRGRVYSYYGDRVDRWLAARARLLDATGRRVFGAQILADVGL